MSKTLSHSSHHSNFKSPISKFLIYLYFAVYMLIVLLPFYVVIITSLTPDEEIWGTMKFVWFPENGPTLQAYKTALFSDLLKMYDIGVLRSLMNTLWQTLPPLLANLFLSGLAAFAFAKLHFPGKNIIFAILLGSMMIPSAVLSVPSLIYYNALGWTGTVLPLMVPGMFGSAMMVFFLRQFFDTIPTDLVGAAKIDGMGYTGIYIRIIVPLAKPAFLAQFIFGFVGGYNSYLSPLLYLNGQPKLYPLQMTLTLLQSMFGNRQALVCAFLVLGLAPLLIIYAFSQKYFIEGIATTGIKG